MSQNNLIKKSDKKFIRREKARIRSLFLDVVKQEEMISELYSKFLPRPNLNNELVANNDESIKSQIPSTKSQINPKSKTKKSKSKIKKVKT